MKGKIVIVIGGLLSLIFLSIEFFFHSCASWPVFAACLSLGIVFFGMFSSRKDIPTSIAYGLLSVVLFFLILGVIETSIYGAFECTSALPLF